MDILRIMLKHWEQKNTMPQDRFAKLLEIACLNCEVECVQSLLDAGMSTLNLDRKISPKPCECFVSLFI